MIDHDQSLAWLLRGAAQDVLTTANASYSVWDTRGAGGNWKEFRLSTLGIEEQDYEDLATSGTGVSALGRVLRKSLDYYCADSDLARVPISHRFFNATG